MPAPRQADNVINRLRDRGTLASTDGPHHNVLKLKPPMPFSAADADRLVTLLGEILAEDAAQPSFSSNEGEGTTLVLEPPSGTG